MKLKDISKVKSRAEARQIAMDWQSQFADKSLYWSEVAEAQAYFEKLGRKFKLTAEFKENGII
jgi:hypothetical protein